MAGAPVQQGAFLTHASVQLSFCVSWDLCCVVFLCLSRVSEFVLHMYVT